MKQVLPFGARIAAPNLALLNLLLAACGPQDDVIFSARTFRLVDEPLLVLEGAGVTRVVLRLAAASNRAISADYSVKQLEAQDDCQLPDFELPSGRVTWAAGETEAAVELYVGDDELPELDERLQITVQQVSGAMTEAPSEVTIVIRDNDNTGVVDARANFGVEPGLSQDQAAALQAALGQAEVLGRGVVLMAPGDYQVSRVSMAAGTTLSARGVRFLRPAMSGADTITLSLSYTGMSDSAATLVEGLSIDGQREQQGPYRLKEQEEANFVSIAGGPEQAGRLRANVEGLTANDGTASALWIGPNAGVDVCHLSASNMWRDALTLHGGNSALRVRGLDATGSEGTTGIWLGGDPVGYQGVRSIDALVEDARLGTGDVEIVAQEGSHVVLRRLSMTQAPLRIEAPQSTVRIFDSVLVGGVPNRSHNYWESPFDMEVSGTTLIASESSDKTTVLNEADRALVASSVRWSKPPSSGTAHLLFDHCLFERAADVEDSDTVFAIDSPQVGGNVTVRSSVLGVGVGDWFAPGCQSCQVVP